jgi:hypothetical protein
MISFTLNASASVEHSWVCPTWRSCCCNPYVRRSQLGSSLIPTGTPFRIDFHLERCGNCFIKYKLESNYQFIITSNSRVASHNCEGRKLSGTMLLSQMFVRCSYRLSFDPCDYIAYIFGAKSVQRFRTGFREPKTLFRMCGRWIELFVMFLRQNRW